MTSWVWIMYNKISTRILQEIDFDKNLIGDWFAQESYKVIFDKICSELLCTRFLQEFVFTRFLQGLGPTGFVQGLGPTGFLQGLGPTGFLQGLGPTGFVQGLGPTGFVQITLHKIFTGWFLTETSRVRQLRHVYPTYI